MTLSAELVAEWIAAFPITVHVSDRMEAIYSANPPDQAPQMQHKEELKHRRVLDAHDRDLIAAEVEKHPHPLEDHRPRLYNPVTGEVASEEVSVADSVAIGMQWRESMSLVSLVGSTAQSVAASRQWSRRR